MNDSKVVPTAMEFPLGENQFKQPFRLLYRGMATGSFRGEYVLVRDQQSQRDEGASVAGLSGDVILAAAEAVKAARALGIRV